MEKHIIQLYQKLEPGQVRQAVKYLSPKMVIRATRRTYKGKILKNGNIEILFTIGRPNYRERKYIKLMKKLKARFPHPIIQVHVIRG